jgi:hypothetical protein
MDNRDPAEHQRLISGSQQACKHAEELIVTAREVVAEAKALIQRHAIRHAPPPTDAASE